MKYYNKEELISDNINKADVVLDVGFWGQGVDINNPNWTHNVIKKYSESVYGVDTEISEDFLKHNNHNQIFYKKLNAETANFNIKFDIIFAGDLIEHLTNPGLFLDACNNLLKDTGKLILTTPNTFNLFNLSEKITKSEPTVNSDHTFYFNKKVLSVLLKKCGWSISETHYIYKLDTRYKESYKKKFLNLLYMFLSLFTDKYLETLVIIGIKNK